MGRSVVPLIVKLRVAIVCRIKVAEEAGAPDPVELDHIAHDVGTDCIDLNASLMELGESMPQVCFVLGKHHISVLTRSTIITFQPIAVRTRWRRLRSTRFFHHPAKRGSALTQGDALWRVDNTDILPAEPSQCFGCTPHGQYNLASRDGMRCQQRVFRDDFHHMPFGTQTADDSHHNGFVFLYGVWRELFRP